MSETKECQEGNITIIVENKYSGTKTLEEIFEGIIVDIFRKEVAQILAES